MTFPFSEEPITAEEERLIGKASGHLHDRCEEAIGTSLEDQVEAEHDAMMRLRRRHRQVEAALTAKDSEIARLRDALKPFSDAWETVVSNGDRLKNLSLGQLGALASHEVSGVHFQRASAALAGGSDATL